MSFQSFSFIKILSTNLFQRLKISSYSLIRIQTMFFIQEIKGKTEIWIKRRPMWIIRRIKITKAVKSTWIKRIQTQSKEKKSRDVQNNLKHLDTQNQLSSSKFNHCKIIKNKKICLDSLIIFKVQAGIIFYLMTTIIMPNFKVKAIKLLKIKIRIS